VEETLCAIDRYTIDDNISAIEIAQDSPFFRCLSDASTLVGRIVLNITVLGIIILDLIV
jgi:hypothetical protein